MDREEILAKSRDENKNQDLAASDVNKKGMRLAGIVMIFMCSIFYCVEILLTGKYKGISKN